MSFARPRDPDANPIEVSVYERLDGDQPKEVRLR